MATRERIYTTKPNPIIGEVSEIRTENIYLNRLKEQYKQLQESKKKYKVKSLYTTEQLYNSVRLFCLDTQLISFNDIELMESEINSSF